MNARTRLVEELRRSLRDTAEHLVVDDREFALSSETNLAQRVALVPPRRRARWFVVIAALVVLAVAVVGVVARVTTTSRHTVRVIAPPPTTVPFISRPIVEVDSPVLAPTWVPADETLWSFTTRRGADIDRRYDQLIGVPSPGSSLQSAILIELQPESSPEVATGPDAWGQPVTVRGIAGAVGPPKDAGGVTAEINWDERGALVYALVRGMSTTQALTILAGLQPAGPNLATSGYAPTSVHAPYQMLVDAPPINPADPTAVYGYWSRTPTPDSTPDILVTTARRSDSWIYPNTEINGSVDATGDAMTYDPFQGGTVLLVKPDGQQVEVTSQNVLPRSTLERIARSAALLDAADAAKLRTQLDSRLQQLPVIGTANVQLGNVTLRGTNGVITACFTPNRSATACTAVPVGADVTAYGAQTYSQLVAGVSTPTGWVLYSASTSPVILNGLTPETATIGNRRILVALAPATIDQVQIKIPPLAPHFPQPSVGDLTRPKNS